MNYDMQWIGTIIMRHWEDWMKTRGIGWFTINGTVAKSEGPY